MKNSWLKILILRPILTILTFLIGILSINVGVYQPDFTESTSVNFADQGMSKSKASAWNLLLRFEGKDLSTVSREAMRDLENAVFEITNGAGGFGEMRRIAKISNEHGQRYYVLIGEEPLVMIPGAPRLCFLLFDLNGKQVASEMFDAGWRIDLKNENVRSSDEIGREIIEVLCEPVINGRPIEKQTYALVGTSIVLIRLENKTGELVRNNYSAPNLRIGPDVKFLSPTDWKSSLTSIDPADVLASLTWLSGVHLNPKKLPFDYGQIQYEHMDDVSLNEQLESNGEVRRTIEALSSSENKWVREAAKLDLNHVKEYPE